MNSPRVIPLPHAHVCHSALLNVLFEALKRAVARGLVTHADAEELMLVGASRDCAVLRASVEVVLAALESSRGAQVRAGALESARASAQVSS